MKKYKVKQIDSYWLVKYSKAVINQDRYNSLKEVVFSEWPDASASENQASEFTVAIWKVKLKEPKAQPVIVDTSFFSIN